MMLWSLYPVWTGTTQRGASCILSSAKRLLLILFPHIILCILSSFTPSVNTDGRVTVNLTLKHAKLLLILTEGKGHENC